MSLLRFILALGLALMLQAGLGRVWPDIHRFVDVMLIPVVLYGVTSTQRMAMIVGCAAGLLTDTWFEVSALGMNGFKLTLLGWLLGGVATRLDMNHTGGRWIAGCLFSLGDDLLDLALRSLLDQHPHMAHPAELLVKAVVTGLLVWAAGVMLDRVSGSRRLRRFA